MFPREGKIFSSRGNKKSLNLYVSKTEVGEKWLTLRLCRLCLLDGEGEGHDAGSKTKDAGTSAEEGVEGTTLHAKTLVGLDIDHVVLLNVECRALENSDVSEVESVHVSFSICLAEELDISSE